MNRNSKPIREWAAGDGINYSTARAARERTKAGQIFYGQWFLTPREWRLVKKSMGHIGRPRGKK